MIKFCYSNLVILFFFVSLKSMEVSNPDTVKKVFAENEALHCAAKVVYLGPSDLTDEDGPYFQDPYFKENKYFLNQWEIIEQVNADRNRDYTVAVDSHRKFNIYHLGREINKLENLDDRIALIRWCCFDEHSNLTRSPGRATGFITMFMYDNGLLKESEQDNTEYSLEQKKQLMQIKDQNDALKNNTSYKKLFSITVLLNYLRSWLY